ncbi:MAG: HAD family hydrolase [Desulfamplus sp.]
MIEINIPGRDNLNLEHLVLDYNGTVAVDGKLIEGVRELLSMIASRIKIHVITADTFGAASSQLSKLPVSLTIIPFESQAEEKLKLISLLGVDRVAAIGNGLNDAKMLKHAAIGIALIQKEGASAVTMESADIVCLNILDAVELLLNPKRLIATLRS